MKTTDSKTAADVCKNQKSGSLLHEMASWSRKNQMKRKDRIFLFQVTDALFRTPGSRLGLLGMGCCFWIAWQCIWNFIVFWNLTGLSDYTSLFEVFGLLSQWSSCLLVRVVLAFIESFGAGKPFSMQIVTRIFSGGFFLFCLAWLVFYSGRKMQSVKTGRNMLAPKGIIMSFAMLFVLLIWGADHGLSASSVMQVVTALHRVGMVGLGLNMLLFINTLVLFVESFNASFHAIK